MAVKSFKSFLRENFKGVYKLAQKIYHPLRRFLEIHLLGTKIQEWAWRTRHIYKGKSWVETSWKTREYPPHLKQLRGLLLQKIKAWSPSTILEVGCGTGPQLYLLAKELPSAKICGIDVNKAAIKFGTKKFKEEGLGNVQLEVGTADDLSRFNSKSIDVIFTATVMIFIGPDKIQSVVKEMLRVAQKALVFAEPSWERSPGDPQGLGVYRGGHYLRNYYDLFSGFGINEKRIRLIKIDPRLWGRDELGKHAYFIEVNLAEAPVG